MSTEDNPSHDETARQPGRRLKRIGVAALGLGLAGAGFVYWHGTRVPDFSNDPSMTGFNRAQSRQMGILYGKSGQMVDDLVDALKHPEVQAGLIAAISVCFALGCFYLGNSPAPARENCLPTDVPDRTQPREREEK